MLAIVVELLHGTIRCASSNDSTLTGHPDAEWPPSPARLYQALVAADGTGDRCRVTPGPVGLDLLENPPIIRAVKRKWAPESPILSRYVVIDETDKAQTQEYLARKAQLVHPGARVAPKVPVIAYVWPEVQPSLDQLGALQKRCARVAYLGASDSPVRIRAFPHDSAIPQELPWWVPSQNGDVSLPVAYPGFLSDLDTAFTEWSQGKPMRASWIIRPLAAYSSPDAATRDDSPRAPCLWLRLDRSLSGRHVLAVTQTLRAALLQEADRVAGGPQNVPAVIHGHHPAGTRGVEHCRILALPNVGFQRSDGRIHGACVWFPPGTDPGAVELARTALAAVRRLVGSGVDVGISYFDGSRAPLSSNPARWVGPAKQWVSAFPVVYERRVKGPLQLADVSRWCTWAGLPEPVSLRVARVPLTSGALTLAPTEVLRSGESRPYAHIELEFSNPVVGPVALGWGRHFGLGLMAPIKNRDEGDE